MGYFLEKCVQKEKIVIIYIYTKILGANINQNLKKIKMKTQIIFIEKKIRRKIRRQNKALKREEFLQKQEQNRINSPTYQKWLKSQKESEEFEQNENERIAIMQYTKWVERECAAIEEWKLIQKKLDKIKQEKVQKELLIKLEWEREQKKIV